MVRVISVRVLDNCLDSAPIKEYELDGELSVEIMNRLAADGRLQYFPHFPKAYFRIDSSRGWVAQGIIGNRSLRVTFSPGAAPSAEDDVKCVIES